MILYVMICHEFVPSLPFATSLSACRCVGAIPGLKKVNVFGLHVHFLTPEAPDVADEKGSDKEILYSSIGILRFNLKFNHRPKAIKLDQQHLQENQTYCFLCLLYVIPVFLSFFRFYAQAKRRGASHAIACHEKNAETNRHLASCTD